jgi:hypothetical protein
MGTPKKPSRARTGRTDVGYRRPPKEHQFKPGQSGNRNGRPKAVLSLRAAFEKELGRKVTIMVRGKPRRVPLLEAIISKLSASAARGSQPSAKLLLSIKELGPKPADVPVEKTYDPYIVESYNMLLEATEAYYAHKVYRWLYGPLDDRERKLIVRNRALDWFPFDV